jgi:hypothetical protein
VFTLNAAEDGLHGRQQGSAVVGQVDGGHAGAAHGLGLGIGGVQPSRISWPRARS